MQEVSARLQGGEEVVAVPHTTPYTHTQSTHPPAHPHTYFDLSIFASHFTLHTSTHQHFFHIYTLLTITTDEDYEDSYFFFLVLHLYIQYCI